MGEEDADLLGPAELQELLGVGRSRMRQIARYETFPRPIAKLTGTTIWRKSEVVAWIAKHRQPRPDAPDEE